MGNKFPKGAEIVCVNCGFDFDSYKSWRDEIGHECIGQLLETASIHFEKPARLLDSSQKVQARLLFLELLEEMYDEQLSDISVRAHKSEDTREQDRRFILRHSTLRGADTYVDPTAIQVPNLNSHEISLALSVLPEKLKLAMRWVNDDIENLSLAKIEERLNQRREALRLMEQEILEGRGLNRDEVAKLQEISSGDERAKEIRKALRRIL